MKLFGAKILTVALLLAGVVTPVVAQLAQTDGGQVGARLVSTPVTPPSPSPSPTPSPVTPPITPPFNSAPVITTDSFNSGRVGIEYKTVVRAFDLNSTDLTMQVNGLPEGLSLGPCSERSILGITNIGCKISGVPTQSGEFSVEIVVSDGKGRTIKILPLLIKQLPQ